MRVPDVCAGPHVCAGEARPPRADLWRAQPLGVQPVRTPDVCGGRPGHAHRPVANASAWHSAHAQAKCLRRNAGSRAQTCGKHIRIAFWRCAPRHLRGEGPARDLTWAPRIRPAASGCASPTSVPGSAVRAQTHGGRTHGASSSAQPQRLRRRCERPAGGASASAAPDRPETAGHSTRPGAASDAGGALGRQHLERRRLREPGGGEGLVDALRDGREVVAFHERDRRSPEAAARHA